MCARALSSAYQRVGPATTCNMYFTKAYVKCKLLLQRDKAKRNRRLQMKHLSFLQGFIACDRPERALHHTQTHLHNNPGLDLARN